MQKLTCGDYLLWKLERIFKYIFVGHCIISIIQNQRQKVISISDVSILIACTPLVCFLILVYINYYVLL
jgi:hypothetical protein